MSDISRTERLNIDETIARIEFAIVEAQKYRVEMPKLEAEREKLAVERDKLAAERAKLLSDRNALPWQVIAALVVSGGGLVGATLAVASALHLIR